MVDRALGERFYAVLLHGDRVGTLAQRGDFTRCFFNENHLADSRRPVLGLRFEENPRRVHSSAQRLPQWFSNLLPEGPLREWIAEQRGVKIWSLIYRDKRVPTLSPAYDLVSTPYYRDTPDAVDDLGLKIGQSRRFSQVTLDSFNRLERRIDDRTCAPRRHAQAVDWLGALVAGA